MRDREFNGLCDSIASQSLIAAVAKPVLFIMTTVPCGESQFFMIAHNANEKLNDLPTMASAIDIVAEENELYGPAVGMGTAARDEAL